MRNQDSVRGGNQVERWKCPNNEFSVEEASWAVNLSSSHTTLDAGTGTQGRDGLTWEGRVGVRGCGQSRLKNTWPADQNPVSSSSLERKGRGPRTFRRPPPTHTHTVNTTTNAEGLWPPCSPSLRRTHNWLHCKELPGGTQEPIRESSKTQGPCCSLAPPSLFLCHVSFLLLSSAPHSRLSLPFWDPQAHVSMPKSQ